MLFDYPEADRIFSDAAKEHVRLVKTAGDPVKSYRLAGRLYLSRSGWLLLSVPNALGRGAFEALAEPGTELPLNSSGQYNAHISVMDADEVESIGGPEAITERGKQFHYTLGPVKEVVPGSWKEISKVWYITAYSPELQALRRSYGLPPLRKGYDFHTTIAIRRKNVLRENELSKAAALISADEVKDSARRSRAREQYPEHACPKCRFGVGQYPRSKPEDNTCDTCNHRWTAKVKTAAVSYVPTAALDSIKQNGLMSGEALLSRPDFLAAAASGRGETPESFRAGVEGVLSGWKPDSAKGPNVLFGGPPSTLQLPANHPMRKWDLTPVDINLADLLRDVPNTRVHGQELMPYDEYKKKWTQEQLDKNEDDPSLRHRDLTPEELKTYSTMSPEDLWKSYTPDDAGRYAPNVPHAAVVTPDGRIPVRYLKFPEKTAASFSPDLPPPPAGKGWESKPYKPGSGFVDWYARYSLGQRHDDDAKQMARWKAVKTLQGGLFARKPTPARASILARWGIDASKLPPAPTPPAPEMTPEMTPEVVKVGLAIEAMIDSPMEFEKVGSESGLTVVRHKSTGSVYVLPSSGRAA